MADSFDPPAEVNRDGWGRPLIVPVGGGKPVAYTRASTVSKSVEDLTMLSQWQVRMAMTGLSRDASLVTAVAAYRDDKTREGKRALNNIAETAIRLGQGLDRAQLGTSYHRLVERMDAGEDLGQLQPEVEADLNCYLGLMAKARSKGLLGRHEMSEVFVVDDERKVAGTFDLLSGPLCDLKTGSSADFGGLSWSCQLATYRDSVLYDPVTFERRDLFAELGTPDDYAYVIHLPVGEASASLYRVDLAFGRRVRDTALSVRQLRKEAKSALTRVDSFDAGTTIVVQSGADPIDARIDACKSRAAVERLIDEIGWQMTDTQKAHARRVWSTLHP